jgi:hypothetical protein
MPAHRRFGCAKHPQSPRKVLTAERGKKSFSLRSLDSQDADRSTNVFIALSSPDCTSCDGQAVMSGKDDCIMPLAPARNQIFDFARPS